MIRSFKCRETERIFHGGISPAFPHSVQGAARRKLAQLDGAHRLTDLAQPRSNRLEALKGKQAGQWSIRVNDQFRLCFVWDTGPGEVELVDYH
jgi:proteic killer suppression protein